MDCCRSSAHADLPVHLETTINLLKLCKAAVEILPVPGIVFVVDALIALVNKVKATETNEQALTDLSQELLGLSRVVDSAMRKVQSHLQLLPPNRDTRRQAEERLFRQNSPLQERIKALHDELSRLNAQADELQSGHFLFRCMRSRRDLRVLRNLKVGVGRALTEFSLGGELTVEALVDDIVARCAAVQDQVGELRTEIAAVQVAVKSISETDCVQSVENLNQTEADERALEALPHVEAGYRSAFQALTAQYIHGTFTDVLEELNAWAYGGSKMERHRKAAWILYGPPGSGKSTIASRFARELHGNKLLGASFSFSQTIPDLSSARRFFSTIAYQLARNQPALYPHIAAAAREHLRAGTNQQMEYDFENLILRPLRELPSGHNPIVLVVDGLDECAEDGSSPLAQMLRLLLSCMERLPSTPLRILLASRPHGVIDDLLDRHELRSAVHHLSLSDRLRSAARDIRDFYRSVVPDLGGSQQHAAALKTIASHAAPSFAYARVVAGFLQDEAASGCVADRLGVVLSLGACRRSSLYALYPAVVGRSHTLNASQWKTMRARVERPSIFMLCGTAACYQQVVDWLTSPYLEMRADGVVPEALLCELCPTCRIVVENEPLEAWMLKKVMASLLKRGVDHSEILPSFPSEGATQRDHWLPAQRATSSTCLPATTPDPSAVHAQTSPDPVVDDHIVDHVTKPERTARHTPLPAGTPNNVVPTVSQEADRSLTVSRRRSATRIAPSLMKVTPDTPLASRQQHAALLHVFSAPLRRRSDPWVDIRYTSTAANLLSRPRTPLRLDMTYGQRRSPTSSRHSPRTPRRAAPSPSQRERYTV
ncbi:hypothetical protein PYCCODRAFT_1512023 [Trametes coccinea BRFM310]|uniref:NACHT domain-containing protein n=1 Tax=Trametes coccinea (strain BRFM310) TaxID=1353009 RepID=A0A1Y2IG73_TRAC3|nr:hypothetical protein PYCCODRAFT_1512023 [Trametes coccinea BRFM310]